MSKKAFVAGSAIGALLASVAVLLLPEKKSKELRKAAAKHAQEVSERVAKELPNLKKASKKTYSALVDRVMNEYENIQELAPATVKSIQAELKEQWDEVKKRLS